MAYQYRDPEYEESGTGRATRICLMITAILVMVSALVLTAIGILSPAWMWVWIQEHWHGLWMYCIRSSPGAGAYQNTIGTTWGVGSWICDTKWSYNSYMGGGGSGIIAGGLGGGSTGGFGEIEHSWMTYEVCVLILLIIGFFSGLASMISSYCGSVKRFCVLCMVIGSGLAMVSTIIACLIYYFYSQQLLPNRTVVSTLTGHIYVGWRDYAFYCSIAAACLFFIHFFIILALGLFAWRASGYGDSNPGPFRNVVNKNNQQNSGSFFSRFGKKNNSMNKMTTINNPAPPPPSDNFNQNFGSSLDRTDKYTSNVVATPLAMPPSYGNGYGNETSYKTQTERVAVVSRAEYSL